MYRQEFWTNYFLGLIYATHIIFMSAASLPLFFVLMAASSLMSLGVSTRLTSDGGLKDDLRLWSEPDVEGPEVKDSDDSLEGTEELKESDNANHTCKYHCNINLRIEY